MWVRNVDLNECVAGTGVNFAGICKSIGIVGESGWIENDVDFVVCGFVDPRDKFRFAIALSNVN
jgi:hypothetical protein